MLSFNWEEARPPALTRTGSRVEGFQVRSPLLTALTLQMHDPKMYAQGPVQGTIVVMHSVPMPVEVNTLYNWKKPQAKRVGVAVLVVAAVALACNIIWLAIPGSVWVQSYSASYLGIWGAIFFAIPGMITLLAGMSPTKCRLAWALVMAMLAFIAAIAMLTIGSLQLVVDHVTRGDERAENVYIGCIIFGTIFIVLSVAGLVLLLMISILSCRGLCCSTTNPGLTIAIPQPAAYPYLPPPPHNGQIVAHPYGYGSLLPCSDVPPPYDEQNGRTDPFYPPPSYSVMADHGYLQPK